MVEQEDQQVAAAPEEVKIEKVDNISDAIKSVIQKSNAHDGKHSWIWLTRGPMAFLHFW